MPNKSIMPSGDVIDKILGSKELLIKIFECTLNLDVYNLEHIRKTVRNGLILDYYQLDTSKGRIDAQLNFCADKQESQSNYVSAIYLQKYAEEEILEEKDDMQFIQVNLVF